MTYQPFYKLVVHEPVPCTYEEFRDARLDSESQVVDRTDTGRGVVSTVFLGIDHATHGDEPLLFETLVFDGPLGGKGNRYATWDEAELGHALVVERVRRAPGSN